jgi:integrase
LKLKLSDLDLERQVAILRETKNRETRKAPIVGYLKGVLEEHLKWRKKYLAKREVKSDYLFPRSDGKGPIDIRKAWENARDKAGVIDFRFHDLRHSAASYLAMNGASQLEIAEVLGHKTLQMVKRYSHLSEDHTRDVVERMNKKVFES